MELHNMDHGGGWPDAPYLPILEEINRGGYYDKCSIDEFLTYYTSKSKDEVSNPRWQSGDTNNGLAIFWHQKEDESEPASTACPSDSLVYMTATQTHEPNKETLQHQIISVLKSPCLPTHGVLIQLWAPTKIRGRMVLTTSAQPFGLSYDINFHDEERPPEVFYKGICRYRKRCLGVMYDVTHHGGNTESGGGGTSSSTNSSQQQQQLLWLGPPERVFKQGFPELSRNIDYCTTQEFQLRDYARNECGIKASLAIPLFESTGGHHCLGVLEIVAVHYNVLDYDGASFFETLESAHLRSQPPHLHECSKIRKNVLSSRVDIKEVLKFVREVHHLPLVQAWVSCMCDDHAFKTTNLFCDILDYDSDDDPLYIYGDSMISILNYGSFSIQPGKGLVGRAYSFKKPCFCRDTSQFSISDYPIVHFTSEAELTACFAIPLHFLHPSLDALVLEIFLPHRLEKYSSDRDLLSFLKYFLSTIINEFARHDVSLGLQQWDQVFSVELVSSSSVDDDDNIKFFNVCRSGGNLNWHNEALDNARAELQVQSSLPPLITGGINITNHDTTKAINVRKKQHSSTSTSIAAPSKTQDTAGTSTLGVYSDARAQITLDVLQQYSGVNLIDTAKSLGVSRSTLKRICREQGIKRWPSHKRKKADHHIHSSDPGLPAGAVQIVDEEAIQESQGGNPRIVNALSEIEAAISIIPTTSANAQSIALGGDKRTSMIVKATYRDDTVMFSLPCNPSGILHLRREIAKRFELQLKSFTIKYKDEQDGDLIMIACDEDLDSHIEFLKSSWQRKIKLSVFLKINGAE
ncbi:hypothetical protein ACH5RR_038288 [Cinchona calisaya]|uniref:Uncharacterized protein n=1 Tax=Cinchona calisaya TaxID=153742 RepID=A0ABD2Y0B5_9GENT